METISEFKGLNGNIVAFKEAMSVITAENVMTIKLTPELIAQMNAASQQFKN